MSLKVSALTAEIYLEFLSDNIAYIRQCFFRFVVDELVA